MEGLIVDSFAGGGGASLGIAWGTGRSPDIAINHDAAALAMHAANHPSTKHVHENVWKADFRKLIGRRRVALLWASPDCKHFSRAKGSVPVSKEIRSLAWVIVRWASQVKPAGIMLENVREFADWGPLVPRWCCDCGWRGTEGQATLKRRRRHCPRCESSKLKRTVEMMPDPDRKGMTFRLFVNRLRGLGYVVDWKNLNAADFGAPTHRRRLFLIARRDGQPIEWPEPTHIDPAKLGSQPMFDRLKPWRTAAECIDWSIPCPSIFDRPRPLAEKTMRRIALGIKRYVLENQKPFIVPMTHGNRPCGVDEPLQTVTTQDNRFCLVAPTLVQVGYSEREGQAPRVPGLDKPLGTVVGAGKHALVTAVISQYHGRKAGESRCQPLDRPFNTIDTQPRYALVTAFMAKHFGGVVGVPVDTPLPTTTAIGTQNQIVVANLVRFNHDDAGVPIDKPMPTVMANNHFALVYAFLIRYFGTSIGQYLTEPLYTITGTDRFALVIVTIAGTSWAIVDIGMRMLTPRELARAQGFPDTYLLTGSKTNQVARIGNSVCPHVAAALARANCGTTCAEAVA